MAVDCAPMTDASLPTLHVVGTETRLESLYASALENVFVINTTHPDDGGAAFVRAGGDYPTPWTRDAAINCWNALSLLRPDLAASTLRAVVTPTTSGDIIAQDDQWWDQIIWVVGALHHAEVTGDHAFGAWARYVGLRALDHLEDRFDQRWGLYRGGAVMQDGISGYPFPTEETDTSSSFVLDYPRAHTIMCLSTNAVYARAHQLLGRTQRAEALISVINNQLWDEDEGRYGYFLDQDGVRDHHQELIGLALAIEFGIAEAERTESIVTALHREPRGLPLVWPHFERYDDAHPGRHNTSLWPMAMGFWGTAAAKAGHPTALARTLDDLIALVDGSDGRFFELYHPHTGVVDGGWQSGRNWPSVHDQTWSATALLRLVHEGLFGLRFNGGEAWLSPTLPPGYEELTLTGLTVRDARWTVSVSRDNGLAIDDVDRPRTAGPVHLPSLTGEHTITIGIG